MAGKKWLVSALGLLAAGACFASSAYFYDRSNQSEPVLSQQAGPETDFYAYVNGAWLEETEIPADAPMYGVADEVAEQVGSQLYWDIEDLVSGQLTSDVEGMADFIAFYQLAMDFPQREKDGTQPIQPYLDKIEAINSLEDLDKAAKDLVLSGLALPLVLYVADNTQDTSQRLLELSAPASILPDVSYYEDESLREDLLGIYRSSSQDLLQGMGYDQKTSQDLVEGALTFDALLVPHLMTAEEASDITNLVNHRSLAEVKAYSDQLDLAALMTDLVDKPVTEVNVTSLAYFEQLDQLLTKANFADLKAWMILQTARGLAPYLDEGSRQAVSQLDMAISGLDQLPAKEDKAYELALTTFSSSLSVYYGQTYFGQEAKDQVIEMIETLVEVYKDRLRANDWLSAETKRKAIDKLDKMTYYVGYPDQVDEGVAYLDVDASASLLDNVMTMDSRLIAASFEDYELPIDKDVWHAPSYEVNAYYLPTNNSITFPAAILQAPFYDLNQSLAANYGGIGAVIGHEMTHAFDSNGARFDAEGNMANWWLPEDQTAFEDRLAAMVAHFDGLPIYEGQVNGQLTVTENTADAGGLAAALDALKRLDKDPDLETFFESYAISWRNKVRPDFGRQVMLLDEHAPDVFRVNRQVHLLEDFYETYGVVEGDAMYLPEGDRPRIW